MTSHGFAATRYRRAIETRSLFLAELAAREMGHLPLDDALGLLELYSRGELAKYERAAVRWPGRLALEKRDLPLRDVQLAAAALAALPTRRDAALKVLVGIAR